MTSPGPTSAPRNSMGKSRMLRRRVPHDVPTRAEHRPVRRFRRDVDRDGGHARARCRADIQRTMSFRDRAISRSSRKAGSSQTAKRYPHRRRCTTLQTALCSDHQRPQLRPCDINESLHCTRDIGIVPSDKQRFDLRLFRRYSMDSDEILFRCCRDHASWQ